MRLDRYLVSEKLADTRSKAQQFIKTGMVSVDGEIVLKPSTEIDGQAVRVAEHKQYVSRAAWKLAGFLPKLPFSVGGMQVLDIGASTGGFTQVLLESGAASVDAVDVGSEQLHPLLRDDGRVRSIEQTDVRNFAPGKRYELVTSDVSFIALSHILGDVDRLASRWIVLLFKPQFEVGREAKRDRKGVVTDEKAIFEATQRFETACRTLGWRLVATEAAQISGKEGNVEQCYCFEKH